MQISKALNDMINEQIAHELIASNQYLQLATYFDGQALKKLSEFFYKQSEEEREHALKFVHEEAANRWCHISAKRPNAAFVGCTDETLEPS